MRGLRAISLAALVACATGLGGPARAGNGELRGSEMPEGYGRLVLSFDSAPKTSARIANGILILSFSDASEVRIDKILREMPSYIGMVRADPDGLGLRFALTRPYRVNLIEAGERVFVDLLPENWKGLLPGLPADVVEELTRRARMAEARARDVQREQAAGKAGIAVRGSRAANLARLLFDIDSTVPVSHKIDDGQIELAIGKSLALDPARVRPLLPQGASLVAAETSSSGTRVVLAAPKGWDLRGFREDDSFVVDFLKPKPAGSTEQAAAPPPPEAKPEPKPDKKSKSKPIGIPIPEASKPDQATVAAKQELDALISAAANEPKPAADAPPAASPPAQSQSPLQSQVRPDTPPLAAAAKAEAPSRATEPPRPVRVTALRQGDGGRIDFDFSRRTGAAAFEHDGVVTLVFDGAHGFDPAALPGPLGELVSRVEVERQASALVARLTLARPQLARLSPNGQGWSLTLGETALSAAQALAPRRGIDEAGLTIVAVPMTDIGAVHWINVPGAASPWAVVTAAAPTRAMMKPYRFVEFDLAPTAQGVAVAPRADDVIVRAGVQEVEISRNGGLAVSIAESRAADDPAKGPKVAPIVDGAVWSEWRLGPVRERLREAGRAAAAAGRENRADARMKLASMMLASELASEAIGPIEAAMAEDPGLRTDKRALMLRGIAQILLWRNNEALETLSTGALKEDAEAGIWRGMAAARLGRYARALPDFRRGAEFLEAYPDRFQGMIREQVIRSALAAREFGLAQREQQILADLPRDLVSRDLVTLMHALIDDALGRPESAISAYRSVFDSNDRPVAAEAQLRAVMLAQREKSKSIPDEEALNRLETISVVWRGGEIEVAALGELGRIYADKRQWREAFAVAKRANDVYPDNPVTRALHDRTAAQFEELFTTGGSDKLSRVEALALFYDFKQFLPIGRRGDEIIRHLADRMVELDLLDQAADMLQYQIDRRLTGAARSVVAARLAMIRLMSQRPADALAAIISSRLPELPADVKRARLLLEAKALSDLSRTDLALEILTDESGPEIERLKADILWTGRRWREAGEAHERILANAWRRQTPLDERERRDVMRAAMAYVMSDEAISLDRLRTKYSVRMAETPDARSFAFITAVDRRRTADMRELARSVASADTISEFLQEYRKRYPDYATVQRAREAARAEEAAKAEAEAKAQQPGNDPAKEPAKDGKPEPQAQDKSGEKPAAGKGAEKPAGAPPQAEAKPDAKAEGKTPPKQS